MSRMFLYRGCVAVIFCGIAACSSQSQYPKIKKVPLVSVQGTVSVDGSPQAGIKVKCIPLGEFEPKEYVKSLLGVTNEDGEFKLGTYEPGDGLPLGDYALTFVWEPIQIGPRIGANKKGAAEDLLHGRYATMENAPIKINVEPNQPLTLEPFDLKTK
jgi:hypothetical protein